MSRPVRARIRATAQAWYHIDQGTAFFPYEWFVALEQTGGQERLTTPGHMQRFGFLSNPPHQAYNPDGLPIGFSPHRASPRQGSVPMLAG